MLSWLTENPGTIAVSLLLILIVVVIIIKLINDKKRGVSACGGNCASCGMYGNCGTRSGQDGKL